MSTRLDDLPETASTLVVCAHPDDESFGLGAILHILATNGTRVSVLCFTHGEASTLHGADGDLRTVRAAELAAASAHLGVDHVELLDYPDGDLSAQDPAALAEHVVRVALEVGADLLLVFDDGGITGHPDHQAATDAAKIAAEHSNLPVLAWAVPSTVANALNEEFGATFVGRDLDDCDLVISVDRAAQLNAIECHRSQSVTNPVLRRRLELHHATECLRVLRPAPPERIPGQPRR